MNTQLQSRAHPVGGHCVSRTTTVEQATEGVLR